MKTRNYISLNEGFYLTSPNSNDNFIFFTGCSRVNCSLTSMPSVHGVMIVEARSTKWMFLRMVGEGEKQSRNNYLTYKIRDVLCHLGFFIESHRRLWLQLFLGLFLFWHNCALLVPNLKGSSDAIFSFLKNDGITDANGWVIFLLMFYLHRTIRNTICCLEWQAVICFDVQWTV